MDDIRRALNANREQLERAVGVARARLDEIEAEAKELRDHIQMADAVLRLSQSDEAALAHAATLRAAMKVALKGEPEGLAAPVLAAKIRDLKIYERPNGRPVDPGQIHNRVHHYPQEFVRDRGRIRLAANA